MGAAAQPKESAGESTRAGSAPDPASAHLFTNNISILTNTCNFFMRNNLEKHHPNIHYFGCWNYNLRYQQWIQ